MSQHSDAGGATLSRNADAWISANGVPYDESVIAHLFESEARQGNHIRHPEDLLHLGRHITSRQDSINWILKVHALYDFNPVTALLSVNYLDRFLSCYSIPGGWAYQLLSVACLALATKMEEQYVPLLSDLQVMEPTHLFDPNTVQKMELIVTACLDWKLWVVTPFDFRDYFLSRLSSSLAAGRIASTFADTVMNTVKVLDFLRFPPSVIAAAAAVLATGNNVELPDAFYERVNKEMVRSCHQLMEEYLVDTCHSAHPKVRPFLESLLLDEPSSPAGVLDSTACDSCDTRSDDPPPPPGSENDDDDWQDGPERKRPRASVGD